MKGTEGWNPWHGCHKLSPGCQNCYVYRQDSAHGKDSRIITKTAAFDAPVKRGRNGAYAIEPGTMVWTCFTSDFLLEEADVWRQQAWDMIRQRSDCKFLFITKRIHRFMECVPPDWGNGWAHVSVGCTVENQDRADYRLPIFKAAPIAHKEIICEPLLEELDLSAWLGPWADGLHVGGESGNEARPCHYDWVLSLRRQCVEAGVSFRFRQTGARFVKDGRGYRIMRKDQHTQAHRAQIDYDP